MLHRLVIVTSWAIVGCFASVAQATVVPTIPGEPMVLPFPGEPLPATLPLQPNPFQPALPGFDFDLPDSDTGQRQPRYNEQPLRLDQLPLRLVIRLSQRRVTVYRGTTPVRSYPVAVGKPGWETPKGTYQVRQMFRNPTWINPLKKGITIPAGDPENPLGRYWIGFWTDGRNWIGFHGTPNPGSIGTAASHGCVRMHNKDIAELFQKVSLGTEVRVVQ